MDGKVCSKCRQFKEFKGFYKNKSKSDGLHTYCKDCANKYTKKYHLENKEHVRGLIYKHHKQNPIYQIKYREKNPRDLYDKKYREGHKDQIKKYKHNYYKTEIGKEVIFKGNLKRRSHKSIAFFSPIKRKKILERDNCTCQYCGVKVHDRSTGNWNTPDKAHIDHIIPVSKGGMSEPTNLQVLCRTCNLSKNDKLVLN
jgi:hypothetical protein